MEKPPKILVSCCTYSGMKYCFNEFISALKSIDYPNYDILIADNSDKSDFFKECLEKDKSIIAKRYVFKNLKPIRKIVRTRNKILQYAIDEGYDFVFMVDADVIVPGYILKQLLSHKKDIVSGIYYNIFTINKKDVVRPVAWIEVRDEEFEKIKKHLSKRELEVVLRNGGLRRFLTKDEASSGNLIKVLIPSAGCMLLSRRAFSVLRYGLLEMGDNLTTSDDVYFSIMAREKGFEAYVDTSLVCPHLVEGKMKLRNGELVHPAFE